MKRAIRRMFAQSIGVGTVATLATVGVVALRHALETPQPLKSRLPGESLLYVWQRRSIFYKVLGEVNAPPLVLLHAPAIGASAHEMQQLIEPLARTYRVYAPDLLGFGLSDRPGIEYSAELYTELCQDFLRDVVQQPVTLMASKRSCNYAVAVASHTPELCSSLVLISPLALHSESQPPAPLKTYAERPVVKALLYPLISTRLAFLLTHGRRESSQADFAQFYAVTHQLGAEHAAMALLAGKLDSDAAQLFEALNQPVLLIWGMQALEQKHYLASLHSTTRNHQARTVELIQNADLAVHLEQPVKVIAAIQRWQAENALQPATQVPTLPAPTSVTPALLETFENTQVIASEEEAGQEKRTDTSNQLEVSLPVEHAGPADEESENTTENPPEAKALVTYCVKCKQKTAMRYPREFIMKNGRLAVRGICVVCGSSIIRIGGRN